METNTDTEIGILGMLSGAVEQVVEGQLVQERDAVPPDFIGDPTRLFATGDPASLQPRDGAIFYVYQFDLSVPEEKDLYVQTLNDVGTSPFLRVRHLERHWDEKRGAMIVYIEVEKYVKVDPYYRNKK